MNPYTAYSDPKLVDLLKQSDKGAFGEIYTRYWQRLFNAAHKRLGSLELCEELVQDVFVKVWERREVLSVNTGLSNYLHSAVKYSVIDHYRKRLNEHIFLEYETAFVRNDNSTEEQVILNDLKRYLETMEERLPDKCRSVYCLSRHEHKTNKEIAAILNISEKTVEGHLTKALQILRSGMSDYLALAFIIFLKKNL